MVYKWLNNALTGLFPSTCCICNRRGDSNVIDICQDCLNLLPKLKINCVLCAKPLETEHAQLCGSCLNQPPHFDQVISAFPYDGIIRHLISEFKFQKRLNLLTLLSELFYIYSKDRLNNSAQAIIPMPLHHTRLKERGFNQSLELARPLAKRYKLPLLKYSLVRCVETAPQTTLRANQRQANVKGAFKLIRPLNYEHVILLDDVLTTGSTAHEAANCLKNAGVKRVDVWCLARGQ